MGASVTAGWENFFVAEAGASAALTGLVFVAVAINLPRILSFPHLPGRAGQTLVVLLAVLVISTFGLIPSQSGCVLGTEFLISAGAGILSVSWMQYRSRVLAQPEWRQSTVITGQIPFVPFMVSGVLLIAGRPSALLWMAAGTFFSFVAGIVNAWVLLVEILR